MCSKSHLVGKTQNVAFIIRKTVCLRKVYIVNKQLLAWTSLNPRLKSAAPLAWPNLGLVRAGNFSSWAESSQKSLELSWVEPNFAEKCFELSWARPWSSWIESSQLDIRPCLISGTLSFEFVRLQAWRWSISEGFSLKTFSCNSSDLVNIQYFTKNHEIPKFFENLFWFQNIDYEPLKNQQFFPKINIRT